MVMASLSPRAMWFEFPEPPEPEPCPIFWAASLIPLMSMFCAASLMASTPVSIPCWTDPSSTFSEAKFKSSDPNFSMLLTDPSAATNRIKQRTSTIGRQPQPQPPPPRSPRPGLPLYPPEFPTGPPNPKPLPLVETRLEPLVVFLCRLPPPPVLSIRSSLSSGEFLYSC